jgi:integrase
MLPGELRALQRDDVDLVAGRLIVRRNVWRGHFSTPKSGGIGRSRSQRYMHLSPAAKENAIRMLDVPLAEKRGRRLQRSRSSSAMPPA